MARNTRRQEIDQENRSLNADKEYAVTLARKLTRHRRQKNILMDANVMPLLVVFVLLAGLFNVAVAQDSEITESILPEIKRQGVTGRLKCVIINKLENPVSWITKNTQTTISTDDKIVIDDVHNTVVHGYPKYQIEVSSDGDKTTFILVVNRLEPRDAGNYTCQILIRGNNLHPSKDGELVVLIPPSIELSETTHSMTMKAGSSANITCSAMGFPTPNITWVRINGEVLPTGELRHQGPYYEIINIQAEHRGIYRCLADNNVRPPAHHDMTIFVDYIPIAKPMQSSYGQAENRMLDLVIECTIAGYPQPELQWYQVGDNGAWIPINNDNKHAVNILLNHANILSFQERWFQLVIRVVQAEDYGDYICEGRNSMGKSHGVITLFETSECQGPNCPSYAQRSQTSTSSQLHGPISATLTLVWLSCIMF